MNTFENSPLTGYIPAGGLGSRLAPHTDALPKPLLPIGNNTTRLIDLAMNVQSGSGQVLVTGRTHADQVSSYLGACYPNVLFAREHCVAGSAGALALFNDYFKTADPEGGLLVTPADHILEGVNIGAFYDSHRRSGADASVLLAPPKSYGSYMLTDGDHSGLVRAVTPNKADGGLSSTGIYIISNFAISKWLAEAIDNPWPADGYNLTHDIIHPWVSGGRVSSYQLPDEAYWDDAGTPVRYHTNNMRLSGGMNVVDGTAALHPDSIVERTIIIGPVTTDMPVIWRDAIVSDGRPFNVQPIPYEVQPIGELLDTQMAVPAA